jgi:hypothetical protein
VKHRFTSVIVAAAVLGVSALVDGQSPPPATPPPASAMPPAATPPAAATPATAAPASQLLTAAQLDQLTAPIALYPDPLLGAVLAAATYPAEVVEADRWLQDPANAALKGDALTAALGQQPWDASVKLLVSFPQVLRMMDDNLEWTVQVGDAFLAQQADVMDSVQRLRQRSVATGALQSTPQQTVSTAQGDITIQPANPDVVYVPYYVPIAVYGPWPWPDYPPFYFPLAPGVVYGDALIGFGVGIGLVGPYWGWYGWQWPTHGFMVYPHRPHFTGPTMVPRVWQHDPAHRGGVPYSAAMGSRYLGGVGDYSRAFRGYPQPLEPGHLEPGHVEPGRVEPTPMARPAPPAFESFGHGPDVRAESFRGFSSRSAPAPAFHGGGGHR